MKITFKRIKKGIVEFLGLKIKLGHWIFERMKVNAAIFEIEN